MPTRYDQLTDLYDRSHEQANRQRDAAISVASHLVRDLIAVLDVPDNLRPGPGKQSPAVETCVVNEDDTGARSIVPRPVAAAVTTEDGETYEFGLIVRVQSRQGFPSHAVLFRVSLRHKLNDRFEVRAWPGAEPSIYSAGGSQTQPFSDFSDQIFNALSTYFTAAVRGERKKPVGFAILAQEE